MCFNISNCTWKYVQNFRSHSKSLGTLNFNILFFVIKIYFRLIIFWNILRIYSQLFMTFHISKLPKYLSFRRKFTILYF